MSQLFHKDWDINENRNTGRSKNDKPVIEAFLQNGLNKKDKNSGLFIPCNMDLTEKIGDRNPWHVNDGRYGNLSFVNLSALNKHEVTIQYESGTGIRLRYEGANCSFESLADNKPKFKAQDGVTLEHTPTYKGVSIAIVLDDPLNAPDSFKFSIDEISTEYTLKEVNGGILLDGPEPIMIHAPWVGDGNGEMGQAVLEIGPVEGGRKTIIKRIVDIVWLRQAVAPVKLDPFVTIEDGVAGGIIEDANLGSFAPDQNQGLRDFIGVHRFAVGNQLTFAAKVVLTAYPGVTAISGNWELDFFRVDNACTLDTYKILLDWNEGTGNPSTAANPGEVTWNSNLHGTSTWNAGGCQGNGTDHEAIEESNYSLSATGSGQILPLTVPTIQDWIDSFSTNYGTITMSDDIPASRQIRARSSQATIGNKIRFNFEYTEEAAFNPSWARNSNQIIGVSQ